MNLLNIILLLPILGVLFTYNGSFFNNKTLHRYSLYLANIIFLLSIFLWFFLDQSNPGFQFQTQIFLIPALNFNVLLGIDGISIYFLILTNLFIYICILTLSTYQVKLRENLMHLFLLQWAISCAFSVLDILGFFVFFEATLIPIFFIVLIWGSRGRKVRASYLISIYTLLGSIFMLFNIIYIVSKTGITNYQHLLTVTFVEEDQRFLWITFFIAFAAKIPLFPLHIWLPEAHVEAPTIGSVLLAALLLKLGTYGLIRFCLPLFPLATIYYTPLIYTFGICGIIYTCLTAIRQVDLKKIIAYSSVGHMNCVLIGIVTLRTESLEGSIYQMLSHGIVSGALFLCVGVIYDRHGTRFIKYYGGLTNISPLLSTIFLIFSMANISFPGTSSFVGEFLILAGIFKESSWVAFFTMISMVLGAVYTLWVYNRVFFGNVKNNAILKFTDVNKKELYIFISLIVILLLMGIYPKFFVSTFHTSVLNLIVACKNFNI
jgi:proton-translocating NADH-quinone oxidoreductase chain M